MPSMNIKPAFDIGEIVYLKTDPYQSERMVTGYYISPGISYELRAADSEPSVHTLKEISKEKDKEKIKETL
jgi:hypothetical protein